MSKEIWGRGLADVLELQRRFNEADRLMFEWAQRSHSMSEHERALAIWMKMDEMYGEFRKQQPRDGSA